MVRYRLCKQRLRVGVREVPFRLGGAIERPRVFTTRNQDLSDFQVAQHSLSKALTKMLRVVIRVRGMDVNAVTVGGRRNRYWSHRTRVQIKRSSLQE